jgi:hypothetical protein
MRTTRTKLTVLTIFAALGGAKTFGLTAAGDSSAERDEPGNRAGLREFLLRKVKLEARP